MCTLRDDFGGKSRIPKNHVGFVCAYDQADTYVVQHDFLHMSFYKEDFKEFVDTLLIALREMEREGDETVTRLRVLEAVPVCEDRL